MELDTSANYLLIQFKEEGDEEWQFDVWENQGNGDPEIFMAYPNEDDAVPDMDRHERAQRRARVISIHGTEAAKIDSDRQFVIYGDYSRLYQFKDVR